MKPVRIIPATLALALAAGAGCASSTASSGSADPALRAQAPAVLAAPVDMGRTAPSPDPRVGLKAGVFDAGEAIWNLRLVSATKPSAAFLNEEGSGDRRLTNSDLAFSGPYAIQGNYSGWQVWDISNASRPTLEKAYVCPGSQSDVSVFRNLLFVSGESTSGRLDCGLDGVADSVSHDRLRGIRIFDISDISSPRYIGNVQTCRGSHTHTVVTDPRDPANVYVYVSGSAPVRSPVELPGCSGLAPDEDPNSALFRIEVIKVPLASPEKAAIVSSPRIFNDLDAPPRHAEPVNPDRPANANRPARRRTGPNQCHDITVYPEIGRAGGACGGYGLLLDITDAAHPRRIFAAADSNFSFWHSATFNNDGTKVLFTDEWGGGSQPRCRSTDKYEWGANAIFDLVDDRMVFRSYYKMPAAQTEFENCVAHNGSLIPIPGRDVMVQGWYQGGISIFDWTDAKHPVEIAFFDRGPINADTLRVGGSWSAYWYNGNIYSSEIERGLDVFELTPSGLLTQNEIDAAKSIRLDYFNAQEQQRFVWPATFALARAYTDQLARSNGLAADRLAAVRTQLAAAEKMSGSGRAEALRTLAGQLDADAGRSSDAAKAKLLATAVRDLAGS
jgi:hypothetical protein